MSRVDQAEYCERCGDSHAFGICPTGVNKLLTPYPPLGDTPPVTKKASARTLYVDPDKAAESIATMVDDIRALEWELACAVTLAQKLGMSWARLGEQLGYSKQGAQQWARRAMAKGTDYELWSSAERDAAARVLGARERAVKWQLRRIVSGEPGISRVMRETISTHYNRAIAERKAAGLMASSASDAWANPEVELWRVEPNGKATPVPNWRAAYAARLRREHHHEAF